MTFQAPTRSQASISKLSINEQSFFFSLSLFLETFVFHRRTSDKTERAGGNAVWRPSAAPSLVELLCLTVCGKEINTVCCSCCALQCFERCHLDIAAVSAADSECVDAGEILPVIEDLKAVALSQKA